MRGERGRKGPRFNTGAPSLWGWAPSPSPHMTGTTQAADWNDSSSATEAATTAGTRKGPTEGPRSLVTLRTRKDLRDEAQPLVGATTQRIVAAARRWAVPSAHVSGHQNDQAGVPQPWRDSDVSKPQPHGPSSKPQEDCSAAHQAVSAGKAAQNHGSADPRRNQSGDKAEAGPSGG